MLEKKEILELLSSRKFVLYSALGILSIKLVGDFLLSYFFGSVSFEDNIIWKFVTTALLVIFGYSYIKEMLQPKVEAYNSSFVDNYIEDLLRLSVLYGIGIALSMFQANVTNWISGSDIPLFVFLQIFGWYYIVITYSSVTLLIHWINSRKNNRTNLFNKVFQYGYIFLVFDIFIIKAVNYYFDIGGWASFFNVISILLFVFVAIMAFALPYDNEWITRLDSVKKRKLKLNSLIFSITSIWTFFLLKDTSAMQNSINWIFPNISYLVLFPTIAISSYQIRILLASRKRIHKRTEYQKRFDGINTLTEFNKFILESNTTNRTHLLDEFMRSLASVISVDFAWAEDYDENDICCYRSIVNTNSSFLESFNNLPNFKKFVLGIESTIIIPSLKELQLNVPTKFFDGALAVIPISERKKRVGTIFLGRYKSYSFSFDEVQIINTFATNYAVAIENSILLADSLEKRRYSFEMQLAQGIQRKIIPQQIPQVNNYSIAGVSIPANELGGDYYDLVYLKNNKPTLLIADVSGKGVSAALYMSQLKGIVMSMSKFTETPVELIKSLNGILHQYTEKQIFITLAAITIENDEGLLKYVRAGHSPLMVKRNGRVIEMAPRGIALGVAKSEIFDANCEEIEIQLQPGDLCFAYTDGFDEMRNTENIEFGIENIRKLIINTTSNQAQELIDSTLHHIKKFMNGTNQYDDLTLLSIIFLGENGKNGKY
jgi:serine phosphatase RsbU (regulator of sigma subunit)